MADAIPQIVWVVGGRVEFFNRQWRIYTGAASDPATAAAVAAQFVHPDDAALTMSTFADARRGGRCCQVEHRVRSHEGRYRWFLVRAEPQCDPVTGRIVR